MSQSSFTLWYHLTQQNLSTTDKILSHVQTQSLRKKGHLSFQEAFCALKVLKDTWTVIRSLSVFIHWSRLLWRHIAAHKWDKCTKQMRSKRTEHTCMQNISPRESNIVAREEKNVFWAPTESKKLLSVHASAVYGNTTGTNHVQYHSKSTNVLHQIKTMFTLAHNKYFGREKSCCSRAHSRCVSENLRGSEMYFHFHWMCKCSRIHFPKCCAFGEMHKEGKGINPLVLYRGFGWISCCTFTKKGNFLLRCQS